MFLEPVTQDSWTRIPSDEINTWIRRASNSLSLRTQRPLKELSDLLYMTSPLSFLEGGVLLKMTSLYTLPGPHDEYFVFQNDVMHPHVPREPFPHQLLRFNLTEETIRDYARFCAELYWPDGWPVRVVDSETSLREKLIGEIEEEVLNKIKLRPMTAAMDPINQKLECVFLGCKSTALYRFRFTSSTDGEFHLDAEECLARNLPTLDSVEIY